MTYKAAFNIIADELKKQGVKISFVSLPDSDAGGFIAEFLKIEIEKNLDWKNRLKVLAHEMFHYKQFTSKSGKWKRFFENSTFKDTPANRKYVLLAEFNASKRAQAYLRKMGFTDIEFEELNDPILKHLHIDVWLRGYIEGFEEKCCPKKK